MSSDEICLEAKRLPRFEQGELIARLLQDFGPSSYDVSDDEVSLRVGEITNGEVTDISHDEFLAGLTYLHPR